MDLKDFIKEAVSSITKATVELQAELKDTGVVVNPPVFKEGTDQFHPGDTVWSHRHIERVKFDVAVTATEESGSKGGGKLKVMAFGVGASAGGEVTERAAAERVSRVSFSIGVALPPPEEGEASKREFERTVTSPPDEEP